MTKKFGECKFSDFCGLKQKCWKNYGEPSITLFLLKLAVFAVGSTLFAAFA